LLLCFLTFSKTLDFETLSCLEKGRERILRNVDLAGVHKFEDGLKMVKWNVLQNDNWMFGWIVLEYGKQIVWNGASIIRDYKLKY